jgi:tetratricopeptide (TPR) repeat protein
VLIAASGFNYVFDLAKKRYAGWILLAVLFLLSVHPVAFMAKNKHYYYIYYNQLVGGLKGAYGNYETDYYFTGQTEASEWLISFLKEKKIDSSIVKATFTVAWQFRYHPSIKTSYFRNEERSQCDWDYAIITNRYIPPYQLKNKIWPPDDAIHIIYADSIPVCAVLERKTKADYYGYLALEKGRSNEAINHFINALKINDKDEMIFYNFARALYNDGRYGEADSVLKKGLEINPDCEPILMYLGNIAKANNNAEVARSYYEKLIEINRKYFAAYVELAKLTGEKDIQNARKLLKTCLKINPKYKPAIIALADTYRQSDPDIARKYDELANTIK